MSKKAKIIVSISGIVLVMLILLGLTYAYFLTRINGNTNTKSISVSTANLALVYGDGNGIIEPEDKILPGTTLDTKTFTVKNEGNDTTDYVVVIENVSVTYAETIEVDGVTQTSGATTTFESNDFVYTLTCTSDGEACNGVDTEVTFPITGGILVGNSIEVGKTHTYSLTITYKDTGIDQSNDMNKTLTAKVNISNIKQILASNKNELGIFIGEQANSYYLSKNFATLKDESSIDNLEWTTYYVNPNGSDSNTGLTEDSPLRYINTAISQTGDNIKIVLPNGVYHGTVIKSDIDGLNKNIMITSEDGIYNEIYSSKVTSSWTLLDSGVYYWISSKTSTDVFTKLYKTADSSYYFDEVSSLDELRSSTIDSWYQELNYDGKAVIYVKLADESQPTASSLSVVQDSRTLIFKNVTPGVNVYFKNIHLENSIIGVGQSAVYVSGNDAYKSNYFFENFKALTLNAYDDSNFYLYDCEFTGKDRGGFFVGNQLVYMENCTSHDTTNDGFSYKTRIDDTGNGVVYEINNNIYNAGLGSLSYINNASTAHGNWKVIRVGGTYKNSQSRVIHDVDNSTSLNMFVTAKTEIGKVAGYESYSFDFSAGTNTTCNTSMYLYKCNTKDSIANISLGYVNLQSSSKIFQYKTNYITKSDGVVDWDGKLPTDLNFYVS